MSWREKKNLCTLIHMQYINRKWCWWTLYSTALNDFRRIRSELLKRKRKPLKYYLVFSFCCRCFSRIATSQNHPPRAPQPPPNPQKKATQTARGYFSSSALCFFHSTDTRFIKKGENSKSSQSSDATKWRGKKKCWRKLMLMSEEYLHQWTTGRRLQVVRNSLNFWLENDSDLLNELAIEFCLSVSRDFYRIHNSWSLAQEKKTEENVDEVFALRRHTPLMEF